MRLFSTAASYEMQIGGALGEQDEGVSDLLGAELEGMDGILRFDAAEHPDDQAAHAAGAP